MGSFIVKVSPQEDFYLKFSGGDEVITFAGSSKEFLRSKEAGKWQLGRSDRFGTSALTHSKGSWEDTRLRVASHVRSDAKYYELHRENFTQYGNILRSKGREKADELLYPLI